MTAPPVDRPAPEPEHRASSSAPASTGRLRRFPRFGLLLGIITFGIYPSWWIFMRLEHLYRVSRRD